MKQKTEIQFSQTVYNLKAHPTVLSLLMIQPHPHQLLDPLNTFLNAYKQCTIYYHVTLSDQFYYSMNDHLVIDSYVTCVTVAGTSKGNYAYSALGLSWFIVM